MNENLTESDESGQHPYATFWRSITASRALHYGYRLGPPTGPDIVSPTGLAIQLHTNTKPPTDHWSREQLYETQYPLGMIWLALMPQGLNIENGWPDRSVPMEWADLDARVFWASDVTNRAIHAMSFSQRQQGQGGRSYVAARSNNVQGFGEFLWWGRRWNRSHLLVGGHWRRGSWAQGES